MFSNHLIFSSISLIPLVINISVSILWPFLTLALDGLQCMIVFFLDHTHLLFGASFLYPGHKRAQLFPSSAFRQRKH